MKNKISQLLRNIVRRIRYRHPLSKIAILASPFLLAIFVYFLWYLLPLASATSIQAGLTLVAEILGVLLGAVFVIIVFLAERLRDAETLLSKSFPNYRQKIIEDADGIFDAKEQLAKFVLSMNSPMKKHWQISRSACQPFRNSLFSLGTISTRSNLKGYVLLKMKLMK